LLTYRSVGNNQIDTPFTRLSQYVMLGYSLVIEKAVQKRYIIVKYGIASAFLCKILIDYE